MGGRKGAAEALVKLLAERVGFEPTRAFTLPVFKTGAFNRSATSPWLAAPSHSDPNRDAGT